MPDKDQFFDDLFPALDSLHPTVPIANKQPYEQVFLAPGTWTKPANATWVDAVVVGGGGGGAGANPVTTAGAGGGGGVNRAFTPVSGPVPVTVGAGGTVGTPSTPVTGATPGTTGGTSAFGPLGPGPVPAIPSTTVAAGGGGGGGPGGSAGASVPSIGGGQGVNGPNAPTEIGRYGTFALSGYAGGAYTMGGLFNASSNVTGAGGSIPGSKGKYGFGGGGLRAEIPTSPTTTIAGLGAKDGGAEPGSSAVANRGGGGGGSAAGAGGAGGTGGSGIVIVRWWE